MPQKEIFMKYFYTILFCLLSVSPYLSSAPTESMHTDLDEEPTAADHKRELDRLHIEEQGELQEMTNANRLHQAKQAYNTHEAPEKYMGKRQKGDLQLAARRPESAVDHAKFRMRKLLAQHIDTISDDAKELLQSKGPSEDALRSTRSTLQAKIDRYQELAKGTSPNPDHVTTIEDAQKVIKRLDKKIRVKETKAIAKDFDITTEADTKEFPSETPHTANPEAENPRSIKSTQPEELSFTEWLSKSASEFFQHHINRARAWYNTHIATSN